MLDDKKASVKLQKSRTIVSDILSLIFHLPQQQQQLHLYLRKSLLSGDVGVAQKEISSIIKPRKDSAGRSSLWHSFLTS